MSLGPQDIFNEVKDLEVLTIEGNVYKILLFWVDTGNFWPLYVELNLPVQSTPTFGANVRKGQQSNMERSKNYNEIK